MCSLINGILPTREVPTECSIIFYHFKESIIGYHFLDFIFFSGITVIISLFLFSNVSQFLNFIPLFKPCLFTHLFTYISLEHDSQPGGP